MVDWLVDCCDERTQVDLEVKDVSVMEDPKRKLKRQMQKCLDALECDCKQDTGSPARAGCAPVDMRGVLVVRDGDDLVMMKYCGNNG